MLHLVDEALERWLDGAFAPGDRRLTISFDTPDRDWSATLAGPTVNAYLWDVRPHPEASAGMEVVEVDGQRHRRPPLPRMALRYQLTAWATEAKDSHQILGALVVLLSRPRELPLHVLPPLLRDLPPPVVQMAASESGSQAEVWSALGGRYRPGLDVLVVATVDPDIRIDVGPPVTGVEVTLADRTVPDCRDEVRYVSGRVNDPVAAGLRVHTPHGATRVQAGGWFLVRGAPGDLVTIDLDPVRTAVVPADGPVYLD